MTPDVSLLERLDCILAEVYRLQGFWVQFELDSRVFNAISIYAVLSSTIIVLSRVLSHRILSLFKTVMNSKMKSVMSTLQYISELNFQYTTCIVYFDTRKYMIMMMIHENTRLVIVSAESFYTIHIKQQNLDYQ